MEASVHQSFVAAVKANNAGGLKQSSFSRKTLRVMLYAKMFGFDMAALLIGPMLATNVLVALGYPRGDFYATLVVALIYGAIAMMRGVYSRDALSRAVEGIRRALFAFASATFMVLVVAFFLKSGAEISRLNFAAGTATAALLMIAGRIYFPRYAHRLAGGTLLDELVVMHGKPMRSHFGTATIVDADQIGLRPDLSDPKMLSYFGTIVQAFDRVLIDSRSEDHRAWALLLKGANVDGEILLDEANEVGAIAMHTFEGKDTLVVARQPLSLANRMQKRLLDLSVAVPLIILLLPVLALVALVIKLESPGPVFFRQNRVGRGNRLFQVLKFRSMRTDLCDADGNRSASRDDDRITRFGRIIRATSVDELPQLLNVLMGDMSLVGPRPHALGSLAGNRLFWQVDETYWLRHQLKPGITGLAQVRGYRGATVEATDLTDRLQSDMEYIQGWDIWRDVAILVNTLRVVAHKNAF
ncbi:exopolysaccharide biosynthesis polyprenyl glycosylphosphotransferase [Allosphingosinicella deserti]|uniref:Sugar transferase n=1 Tax=Allosphingosinicella deserti TaxID=2116704 RepID=A0A2P7QMB9_9SPHN|nr:exopolysaccharide biosynthesis polyprenyl glycosylphosphotransferase [Sphingomonas deserti]PSJ39095.1 sugar transferase [Sphingomonas deserti]